MCRRGTFGAAKRNASRQDDYRMMLAIQEGSLHCVSFFVRVTHLVNCGRPRFPLRVFSSCTGMQPENTMPGCYKFASVRKIRCKPPKNNSRKDDYRMTKKWSEIVMPEKKSVMLLRFFPPGGISPAVVFLFLLKKPVILVYHPDH